MGTGTTHLDLVREVADLLRRVRVGPRRWDGTHRLDNEALNRGAAELLDREGLDWTDWGPMALDAHKLLNKEAR